ncbi:uncharacterized mitochondrial protein-like protein [Tanacetum coccineum]
MSNEFETLMHNKFQMSSMGELSFFLGLQVKQKSDGIFISQDKYVAEILKKFDFASVKTASTPIETNKALVKDEEVEDVDVHLYRSMIGSLMYLTALRPDIMFAVCACARFQVTPKTSHFNVVKSIFRYLKGQPKLGLWYPRDSSFDLEAFSDSDYAGASIDRKSTTGGCQFLGKRLISWQCKKQTMVANSTTEAEYVAAANCCGRGRIKLSQSNEKTCYIKAQVCDVSKLLGKSKELGTLRYLSLVVLLKKIGDEAVHKELGDKMERVATTASSLEAEQDSGCQDTILGDVDVQTRFETTSKQFNDPPLSKVNTFGSGEDNMQLMELMAHCTILCDFVIIKEKRDALDEVRIVRHGVAGRRLKTDKKAMYCFYKVGLKVKKLEQQVKSGKVRRRGRIVLSEDEDAAEDPSKKGRRIAQIDTDPTISLVQDEGTSWFQEDVETQENNRVETKVLIEEETPTEFIEDLGSGEKGEKEVSTANVPVSTASAEVSTGTHDVNTVAAALVYIRRSASKAKDKGKAIVQEPDPPKKLKKRVQVQMSLDEELERKTIDWSDPAVLRYHALQNRPYFVAEVRKNMVMYLKNQARYKQSFFKGMKYEEIRPIFEKV